VEDFVIPESLIADVLLCGTIEYSAIVGNNDYTMILLHRDSLCIQIASQVSRV
jgi:hypothetical protein